MNRGRDKFVALELAISILLVCFFVWIFVKIIFL